ncbi:MAG TPA: hypothetical protein VHZ03_20800 [Trebonia sp.]|nr:hypothetical protein [Trebonia sp.]
MQAAWLAGLVAAAVAGGAVDALPAVGWDAVTVGTPSLPELAGAKLQPPTTATARRTAARSAERGARDDVRMSDAIGSAMVMDACRPGGTASGAAGGYSGLESAATFAVRCEGSGSWRR